jgi:hypothetical protein
MVTLSHTVFVVVSSLAVRLEALQCSPEASEDEVLSNEVVNDREHFRVHASHCHEAAGARSSRTIGLIIHPRELRLTPSFSSCPSPIWHCVDASRLSRMNPGLLTFRFIMAV